MEYFVDEMPRDCASCKHYHMNCADGYSCSKLRKEILALSGVDIMLDENTFKTPYQMLIEIGKVWDNLTDINRANINPFVQKCA